MSHLPLGLRTALRMLGRHPGTASVVVATLALATAATGLHGVMACLVGESRREIGIRMAVGAGPPEILGWVLRKGVLIAGGGVAFGLAAAAGATRLIESLLFATSPTDLATYLAVSLALALTVLLACLLPARRTLRSDPIGNLQRE